MTECAHVSDSAATIVVVDDDAAIRVSTARTLERAGYTVAQAASGAEGEALIRATRPTLALLDVDLGDADGRDICRALRTDRTLNDTFIVMISGNAITSDDQSSGLEGGADGYIVRPVENREMLARVSAFLRIRAAERERASAERLLARTQKLNAVGTLAGGMAHKLNNILMGIMNYAELSRDKLPPEHPIAPWQGAIVEETRRAATLVGQLLAVGRRQFMTPERTDLNTSIALLLGKLRRQLGPAVTLEWQPTDRPLPVLIDPAQLDQVLTELCANASAAMDGRGTVTLATLALDRDAAAAAGLPPEAPADEYAMLRVADTGRGMDAAMQARLFEPFFSTRDPAAGAGLGLAAVHGIARQNSGFITAESTVGSGSVFRIILPLQHAPALASTDS